MIFLRIDDEIRIWAGIDFQSRRFVEFLRFTEAGVMEPLSIKEAFFLPLNAVSVSLFYLE